MAWLGPWILPITAAVAMAGTGVVVWLAWRIREDTDAHAARARGHSLEFECTECQKILVVPREELTPLSGPEMGLVVASRPQLVGRKLSEYVCPHCNASHCFAVDASPPAWIGVNLYGPQTKSSNCLECRKRLRAPHWPADPQRDNVKNAPDLRPDYGLVCSRCGAVCCVACVAQYSRQDVRTEGARCPRCGRSPIEQVFRP
ncbi:MAG TPA: hypothetical protein PKY01_02130 [Candidatus Hydrogenedentes bacterium]|nr:hypothetical protein [Candidatus Hydrogenedentota bacterium]HQH51193.1 hypothetical protein [Candidatus Hydrogenedentota bacterium]HQM50802.1 hypothetical protein [Candidatus Hydrogenedentota bacterium]